MLNKLLLPNFKTLIRINLKYGAIGILVGLLINAFLYISDDGLSLKSVVYNLSFAFFITIIVSNIIAVFQFNYSASSTSFWKYILIFYGCNLIGMVIGTELSYWLVSMLVDLGPDELVHQQDYKLNSLIVLIIGTFFLLLHLQKVNAQSSIAATEVALSKAKQLNTEIELHALQSRINPHFLYNVLNAIVSLIYDHPDKAEEMTIKLSTLFRNSLSSMHDNEYSLAQELEILHTYIDIEKIRFGERMCFEITVPEEVENIKVPRFLLQPLVENAIKHGLQQKSAGAVVRLIIQKLEGKLSISVGDNGVPFPQNITMGVGLQSTFDKLKLLYGANHEVEIIADPKQIKITIPLNR